MKNVLIATAVAAILTASGAHAADKPVNLEQVLEQLQNLSKRVESLEQQNSVLKQENDSLKTGNDRGKAENDYLKSQTRELRESSATADSEISKLKGADWASKVTVKGDVRVRHEDIADDADANAAAGVQKNADRHRERIRARLSVEAKATDTILAGIGVSTAEGNDPRSGNQTLTTEFSRKAVELDLAYIDWSFSSWGHAIGGKMKQPFFKPGQSLYWDNDINPEGFALTFSRGMWFGSAYYYSVNEVSGLETAVTSDPALYGVQVGARLPLGSSNLALAAHYYQLAASANKTGAAAPLFGGSANGNTTLASGALANDFSVLNLGAEFNSNIGTLPLQIWADVARNLDADSLDTAWSAGVLFGKAGNYRTWEAGVSYQVIEKDALFAQLIDSDYAAGISDSKGLVFRAAYAPRRNWTLNATYFMNDRFVDKPDSAGQLGTSYDRLQLDFNAKF